MDRKITKDQIQKLTEEKTDKYTSMKKQMHERKQSRYEDIMFTLKIEQFLFQEFFPLKICLTFSEE